MKSGTLHRIGTKDETSLSMFDRMIEEYADILYDIDIDERSTSNSILKLRKCFIMFLICIVVNHCIFNYTFLFLYLEIIYIFSADRFVSY